MYTKVRAHVASTDFWSGVQFAAPISVSIHNFICFNMIVLRHSQIYGDEMC